MRVELPITQNPYRITYIGVKIEEMPSIGTVEPVPPSSQPSAGNNNFL
jgi:hypothetical protein